MKKWTINYHLPEDIKPEGTTSRSYECHSADENDFGQLEAKFLKKYPTAVIETMRRIPHAIEEL